ncbi:MAG: 50S ribosomal protein L29 [Oscillospiraceae bacterium]|nr:50S ribosomal protein L29 [Oscillospiraceae bacterium]
MKKSDLTKIREMNDEELDKKLDDLKKELFNLRFQHAINQLENPMRLKAVKKEIAVVKTIMRENEIKNAAVAADA